MEKSDFKKPFNKPILEKIGKYSAQVVALALVFILVSLVGFGIGLIDPSLLYATIPLIVIPAFFSFQTSLSFLQEKEYLTESIILPICLISSLHLKGVIEL